MIISKLTKEYLPKAEWVFDSPVSPGFSSRVSSDVLTPFGSPLLAEGPDGNISAISLDGRREFLSTTSAVVDTSKSFSISAWVYLDSSKISSPNILAEDEHALTAVSQNSSTHSVFYLGIRKIQEEVEEGEVRPMLRWSFTMAPEDGRETGKFDWTRANSESLLTNSMLDKWVLLVGVCDAEKRLVSLFLPSLGESGCRKLPEGWDLWKATAEFNVGRSRWLSTDLDFWPGKVADVCVFERALTQDEAYELVKVK